MELLYVGKTYISSSKRKNECLRLFLIRKKCQLDLLYTNGLYFWREMVPNSDVNSPYQMTEIKLSSDKKILIMYYSVKGNQTQSQSIRTFYLNSQKKYVVYEDQFIKNSKTSRNI